MSEISLAQQKFLLAQKKTQTHGRRKQFGKTIIHRLPQKYQPRSF